MEQRKQVLKCTSSSSDLSRVDHIVFLSKSSSKRLCALKYLLNFPHYLFTLHYTGVSSFLKRIECWAFIPSTLRCTHTHSSFFLVLEYYITITTNTTILRNLIISSPFEDSSSCWSIKQFNPISVQLSDSNLDGYDFSFIHSTGKIGKAITISFSIFFPVF